MMLSESKANETEPGTFQDLNSYLNKKQVQHCDECGLSFDALPELLNHRRRFCQNSGYDNLTGLLMKQTGRNDLKVDYKTKKNESLKKNNDTKMKNYGQYSLSQLKHDPTQNDIINKRSLLLYDDVMEIEKHKNNLQGIRPYQNKAKFSQSQGYKIPQNSNYFSDKKPSQSYQNTKSGSAFSYKLNDENFNTRQSNAEYLQNLLLKNQQSISPATKSMIRDRKPMVKQFLEDESNQNIVHCKTNLASIQFGQATQKPTLLNRSDASIANMDVGQKITYAKFKLDELQSIRELYLKNGGQSKEFKTNIEKMITFYEKLLNDCKNPGLDQSRLSVLSRPETPIMKLNDLSNNIGNKTGANNNKNVNSARPDYKQPNTGGFNSARPDTVLNQMPFVSPFNQMMDPNAMMAQNYAHMYHTKVLEDALRLKSEENKKLIEVLMESIKKDKSNQKTKEFKPQELPQEEKYRFSDEVVQTKCSQDRILKLLQEEELDELTLLSKLPIPLQDEKLESIKKNSELRFRMEKEVLKQKLQRLAWQEKIQNQEEERQVRNNQWIGNNNKEVIKSQMNAYLDDFKDEFQQYNY